MVLKESFCPSTGLTVKTCTATKMRHATSRSQKPFWGSWMLKMESSTWTSLCWASSLCRSVWSPTSSCDTRSVLRGRLVEKLMDCRDFPAQGGLGWESQSREGLFPPNWPSPCSHTLDRNLGSTWSHSM